MPAFNPNPDCRRLCAGQILLALLALVSCAGCDLKSRQDYQRESLDRQIFAIRTGKSDYLHFYDTYETDRLLQGIKGLKGIKWVVFEHTDVTPAGFALVATLPDLKHLSFRDTWTHDDRWLEALAASQTLEVVAVDDYFSPPFFSVPKILALPHLRKLQLSVWVLEVNGHVAAGRRWTDQALIDLEQATSLDELELSGEFAQRPADLITLQEALPNCKVSVITHHGQDKVLKPVAELSAP